MPKLSDGGSAGTVSRSSAGARRPGADATGVAASLLRARQTLRLQPLERRLRAVPRILVQPIAAMRNARVGDFLMRYGSLH